jgi:hypothetical protein
MASLRVTYRPRADASPESEARALADVYGFILKAYEERQKGAFSGTPNDVRKDFGDSHIAQRPRRPLIKPP